MSDNVQVENPNVEFVKPCNLCPHEKDNSKKIYDCLKTKPMKLKSVIISLKWLENLFREWPKLVDNFECKNKSEIY